MDIYLDTILWNLLCDQSVEPEGFVQRLATKNARLVLGLHNFYELTKSFQTTRRQFLDRGKVLLSCFNRFIEAGAPCVKDNMELLAVEMWAAKLRVPVTDVFLSQEDRVLISSKVGSLGNGEFDEKADDFLKAQKQFALGTRSGQINFLEGRTDLKTRLQAVPSDNLERWLELQTKTSACIGLLTQHILQRFREVPPNEAEEYAAALLAPPPKNFSRGVVRSDLYYNWRCANRGSVPKDLIDDMYHVLNAVYCDVYATREQGQAEYAPLILTPNTKVAIYSSGPVDQWIENLADVKAASAALPSASL
jgi:hypothetical protein